MEHPNFIVSKNESMCQYKDQLWGFIHDKHSPGPSGDVGDVFNISPVTQRIECALKNDG